MEIKQKLPAIISVSAFLVIILAVLVYVLINPDKTFNSETSTQHTEISQFDSESQFKEHFAKSNNGSTGFGGRFVVEDSEKNTLGYSDDGISPVSAESHVSQTTVQVEGIDEADIVKTDGENIYISQKSQYYIFNDLIKSDQDYPPTGIPSKTKTIKAKPATDPSVVSELDLHGELLLAGNHLVGINTDEVKAFDVSNPTKPIEAWNIPINDQESSNYTSITASRLYNGYIYLVTQTSVNSSTPCPIRILSIDDGFAPCSSVYYSPESSSDDSVMTIWKVNPEDGNIAGKTSFASNSSQSIVYMSGENIYISSLLDPDILGFLDSFYKENRDVVPAEFIDRISTLDDYDISESSKVSELQATITLYRQSLSEDKLETFDETIAKRMDLFYKKSVRYYETSKIVRVSSDSLKVEKEVQVPGHLLNQFSMDEYDGNLRVATTIGSFNNAWSLYYFAPGFTSNETSNDVYILDENMQKLSSVQDLGVGQSIYGVRFLGDKGYVVTFKQTDPLHVLDLSDPKNPKQTGELEIPGYSAYLFPISESRLIGIGREDWKLKASLFDVSDPSDPKELSKLVLDQDYWSEALDTHKAFLLDPENSSFFLPGSSTGYIISYEGDQLETKKALADISPLRALFINNNLYVIGTNKITVLNESDWSIISELAY